MTPLVVVSWLELWEGTSAVDDGGDDEDEDEAYACYNLKSLLPVQLPDHLVKGEIFRIHTYLHNFEVPEKLLGYYWGQDVEQKQQVQFYGAYGEIRLICFVFCEKISDGLDGNQHGRAHYLDEEVDGEHHEDLGLQLAVVLAEYGHEDG